MKLKSLLKESKAWERKFGEPLPTLEDTTRAYKLKQEDLNNPEQTFQERDQKFLDFEKPVQEVSEKISALKLADTGNPAIKSQIESLKKDREQLIKKIYSITSHIIQTIFRLYWKPKEIS